MNKYQTNVLSGILIIIAGIFLLVIPYTNSIAIHYAVAFCMIASAYLAMLTAFKTKNILIPFRYHELHALGMVVYGILILFYPTNLSVFLNITSFFFLYYGLTEMIFCFQVLNQHAIIRFEIASLRLAIGFTIYLGAVIIFGFAGTNQNYTVIGYGIMIILIGINMVLFKTVLKKLHDSIHVDNTEII